MDARPAPAGQLTESRLRMDVAGMLTQMGVIPARPAADGTGRRHGAQTRRRSQPRTPWAGRAPSTPLFSSDPSGNVPAEVAANVTSPRHRAGVRLSPRKARS